MERKIEVSTKTVGWTILVVLSLFFVFRIFEVVVILFLAFLFSSGLSPIVRVIEKLRVPRALSIAIIFVFLLLLLFLAGYLIIPPLAVQLVRFIEKFPGFLSNAFPGMGLDITSFSSQLASLGQNVFKITSGFFGDVFSLVSIFVLTFYMLFERKNIDKTLKMYLGEEKGKAITLLIRKIEEGLGAWARGQMVLCLIIGMTTYAGLSFLGVDYALPLAIIAGILEMVPVIGPIVSAVPAILVAFAKSFDLAFLTVLLYLVIQQAENHLIVPFVMKKAVGMSPLVTIIAIMVGGNLAGVAGMLLAVPLMVVVNVVLKDSRE